MLRSSGVCLNSFPSSSRIVKLAAEGRQSYRTATRKITRSPYVGDQDLPQPSPQRLEEYPAPSSDASSAYVPGFQAIGVKPAIARGVRDSFPEIRWPTSCQAELIPAVVEGKDVLLRDRTGSGKSFGLLLALLSKLQRLPSSTSLNPTPARTSLIIVPHHNLALQMQHWTRQIFPADLFPDLSHIMAVILRSSLLPSIRDQARALRKQPPHIILGTPHALLELAETDWAALGVQRLATVAVDEADALLGVPGRFGTREDRKAFEKHPPPALSLLRAIFEERPKPPLPRQPSPLQIVLMSATLNSPVRRFLMRETNWLSTNPGQLLQLDYASDKRVYGPEADEKIKHVCLLAGETGVRNISVAEGDDTDLPAVERHSGTPVEDVESAPSLAPSQTDNVLMETDYIGDSPEVQREPPPFDPALLETIATSVAVDVPRLALLFCPASASIKRVVEAFVALGVRARPLDLEDVSELAGSTEDKTEAVDEPTLLVATDPGSRGIDLPHLTHVFILGVPKDPVTYVHMSGRVGRFGKTGTSIVVVTDMEKPADFDQMPWGGEGALWGEEKRMAAMYRVLGIRPRRFKHVQ